MVIERAGWQDRSTATPFTVAEHVRELLEENGRTVEKTQSDLQDLKNYLQKALEGVDLLIGRARSSVGELSELAAHAAIDFKVISSIAPVSLSWCSEELKSEPH